MIGLPAQGRACSKLNCNAYAPGQWDAGENSLNEGLF